MLHQLRRQVQIQPGQVAVVDGTAEVTYLELFGWAQSIASVLADQGVSLNDRVAIFLPRGVHAIAAFLATAIVGATYVPLDPNYPVSRLKYMVEDSDAVVVMHGECVPDFGSKIRYIAAPKLEESVGFAIRYHGLDIASCDADRGVYVIYTSGSTGWPKGVTLPHRCIDNMVNWQVEHSPRPDLRTAQFAPLNFDVSFQEILGTLVGGGTLVVMPEELRREPFEFLRWLSEHRIERLFLPYVALNMLAVAATAIETSESLHLVEINTAGEQLIITPAIRSLFESISNCRLTNHYGQSESAMVTCSVLDGAPDTWPQLPAIGEPLPGCELLIDPLAADEPSVGELLVAGAALSLGYLGRGKLNSEKYIAIEHSQQGNSSAFRTGDLVRYDGATMHFISRIGEDVKIRGIRVNPLEVEAWLLEYPGIKNAVCVVVERRAGVRNLSAAITLDDGTACPNLADVRKMLAHYLPEVSIPRSILITPNIPRTASGKNDREAVKEMFHSNAGSGNSSGNALLV